MRATQAATVATTAAMFLVGCGLLRAPLTCEGVPTAECQAAHREAISNGPFLEEAGRVLAATVRPTQYRLCNQGDDPRFDVSFELSGHAEPVVVTVGESANGRLAVCTW